MGQKVNPNGMRIGVIRDWESKWYANSKDFATYLHEDIKIRKVVESSLSTAENDALVSHVEIERVKGLMGLVGLNSYSRKVIQISGLFSIMKEYSSLKGFMKEEKITLWVIVLNLNLKRLYQTNY